MKTTKERFAGIPDEDLLCYQKTVNWHASQLTLITDQAQRLDYVYSDIAGDSRNFVGIGSFDETFGHGYVVKKEFEELVSLYIGVDGLDSDVVEQLKKTREFLKTNNLLTKESWLILRETYGEAGRIVQRKIWHRRTVI